MDRKQLQAASPPLRLFSLQPGAAQQLECVILSCVFDFQTKLNCCQGKRFLLRETLVLSVNENETRQKSIYCLPDSWFLA